MSSATKKNSRKTTELFSMDELKKQIEENNSRVSDFKLPDCANDEVPVPNSLLRSALFMPIQSRDRVFVRDAYVWSQKGFDITYTGWQLNMDDLKVWETILKLTKNSNFGTKFELTAYQILKALGKSTGKNNYDALSSTMIRLANHSIHIMNIIKNVQYVGGLIISIAIDNNKKTFRFMLDSHLCELWKFGDWTKIDTKMLDHIKRKPFTEKLYYFISSHKQVIDLPYDYYRKLMSLPDMEQKMFKFKLKIALSELLEHKFIRSFELDDEIVRIIKP